MPRTRPIIAARRTRAQLARMAEEIRVARATLALPRAAVARRARLANSTVQRAERGDAVLGVGTLAAVMEAVGLDLVLRAYPGTRPHLRDERHAAMVDQIRRAAARTWRARIEVPAGDHGRSADLVLYGADEVIHVEVERRILDLQAQIRSATGKREALAASTERPVRLVVALEDVRHNRAAIRGHLDLVASRFPAGTREIRRVLRGGTPLGRDGLLWLRRP